MFKDRADAGRQLGCELEKYSGQNALVLAIPRGGVEVGYEVSEHIKADLAILISRKLPFPDNPESGFGAISEDKSSYIFPNAAAWLDQTTIERIIEEQQSEILRRIEILRKGQPLPPIEGRTVILVDDGIAMGSTMRVSIMLCKNQKAGRIIVAVPVAGRDTIKEIAELVDEVTVLECPVPFYAVAQVYQNWYDVGDEEVIRILQRSMNKKKIKVLHL